MVGCGYSSALGPPAGCRWAQGRVLTDKGDQKERPVDVRAFHRCSDLAVLVYSMMVILLLLAHWAGSGHLLNGCRWQARRTVPAPGVITSSRFQLNNRDQVSGDELAVPALGGASACCGDAGGRRMAGCSSASGCDLPSGLGCPAYWLSPPTFLRSGFSLLSPPIAGQTDQTPMRPGAGEYQVLGQLSSG